MSYTYHIAVPIPTFDQSGLRNVGAVKEIILPAEGAHQQTSAIVLLLNPKIKIL